MSSLPTERATNLRAAYRLCDVKPLEGEDLDRYYVKLDDARKTEAMMNIATRLDLQEPEEHITILFTGHRGCGKSTELRLLERNWRKNYHVIYLEADEVTDVNDVEYTDLYMLVAQYVEYELRKVGVQLDGGILKDIADWFAEVTQETEKSVESSIAVEGEITLGGESPFPLPFLAKLLAKLTAQIKGGAKTKTNIRRVLEQDFSRLKFNVNLLLDDGTKKLRKKYPDCKGILIILDNLDRCPPHVASRLFFDYAAQVQELRCTLVYTVPISVLYSSRDISSNFNQPTIVPMVNIYQFQQSPDRLDYNETGLTSLIGLLERRIETSKIFASPAELRQIVCASGGHVRHLMQMMREACITAIGRGHQTIQAEDVEYAIKQLQFSFERAIPDAHYPAIAETFRTKRAANDEIGQQTLFNTAVLEYNGKQRWNYPHPTVLNIDACQQAINALTGES